jgi:predicted dehydrogenase
VTARDLNLAYWGSGPISEFHVPALKAAGFRVRAVHSRPGSARGQSFAQRHGATWVNDREEFLRSTEGMDGLVVALETRYTPLALEQLTAIPVPVLVEKPGATDPAQLERLRNTWTASKWMFAYNRRYYSAVQDMRAWVRLSKNVQGIAVWPDLNGSEHQFIINGCHMVDLLRFVFGKLVLRSAFRQESVDLAFSGAFSLMSGESNLVNLHVVPGAPANASVTAFGTNAVHELRPLESYSVYDSMDVAEPTAERPIRVYSPHRSYARSESGLDGKPGFLAQARSFRRLVESHKLGSVDASLDQAIETLQLVKQLTQKA